MSSNKCGKCSKKVSILDSTISKCKCGNIFCMKHRLDHDCAFDYKEMYKNNNGLVKIVNNYFDKI